MEQIIPLAGTLSDHSKRGSVSDEVAKYRNPLLGALGLTESETGGKFKSLMSLTKAVLQVLASHISLWSLRTDLNQDIGGENNLISLAKDGLQVPSPDP